MKKFCLFSGVLVFIFASLTCLDKPKIEPDSKIVITSPSALPVQEAEEQDECKICLSLASETCLDLYVDCFNPNVCSEYFSCEDSRIYELNQSGCYPQCQTSFVDTGDLHSDLKNCACSMCEFECEASCNLGQ